MKGKELIISSLIAGIFFAGCASRKPVVRQDFQKPIGLEYSQASGNVLSVAQKQELDPNIIVQDFFENEDVRSVLDNISEQSGVPMVFADEVGGGVTVNAEEGLHLQKVLELIQLQTNCVFRIKQGTIFVYDKNSTTLIEPEIVPTFRKAQDVLQLFDKELQQYLRIVGDTKTSHSLFISASPSVREEIDKILGVVNKKPPTVLMEIVTWVVSEDWWQELGTELLDGIKASGGASWESSITNSIGVTKFLGSHNYSLDKILKFISSRGKARVWTKRVITTLDGETVTTKILDKEHFRLSGDELHYAQIKEIPADSHDSLCPHIKNETVILDYDIQLSVKGSKNEDNLPKVVDRQTKGSIFLKMGELNFVTTMKGWVEEELNRENPLFKYILPGIFSSRKKSFQNVEFWVLVYPRIVDNINIKMEPTEEGKK